MRNKEVNELLVPAELRSLHQWVCFALENREGSAKPRKVPINPGTGERASITDPDTWGTFEEAVASARERGLDGIGFVFVRGGGYVGIDIDGAVEDGGNISQFAEGIVGEIKSYTEYSPSGTGLHIIAKADAEDIGRRSGSMGLEVYNLNRYFTFTGNVYKDMQLVNERTRQVGMFMKKYFADKDDAGEEVTRPITETVQSPGRQHLSDREALEKAFASGNGAVIKALYNGDMSAYNNDHSRADQALANHLAYWTGGDVEQMDRMFRASGLMRKKWDEKRGGETYGERTILNALSNRYAAKDNTVSVDVTEADIKNSMNEYIRKGFMKRDLEVFRANSGLKTGFKNLDDMMGSFSAGTIVIGGTSGVGKTTFAGQVADYIASTERPVLYFSMEQSRLELATKSISRICARNNINDNFNGAVSAINMRRGWGGREVKKAMLEYADGPGTNIYVYECSFAATCDTITAAVDRWMKAHPGKTPVVFIDYLQIVQSGEHMLSAKDRVDESLRKLKVMQRDKNLVLFLLCSLNRSNYLYPVDFESFKESGGIEYTADVVFGLQLDALNDNSYQSEKDITKKREYLRTKKKEDPRKVELVCLKNRYGTASFECRFNYYARYDLFIPEDEFIPIGDGEDAPFKAKDEPVGEAVSDTDSQLELPFN